MTDKQTNKTEGQHTTGVWRQWRVTWLTEHSTSQQLLWCIDSFVLRNPPLRQAPKRWTKFAMHKSRSHGTSFSFVELPFLNFVQRSGFHPLSLAAGNLLIYVSFYMANFVQLAVYEMASEIV